MTGELAGITGPGSAFVAGLITSFHCAGMCGPLACSVLPTRTGERVDAQTVTVVYHLSRLGSYAVLGGLAAAVGRLPLTLLKHPALAYAPWLLVVFLLALAFRVDQRLPRWALLGRMHSWIARRLTCGSRLRAAAMLGAATPLLPCAPLYFLISLALFAGSAVQGASTLLAFGLGTVPLLWLVQSQYRWLLRRLSPHSVARLQSAFAVALALLVAWRLRGTLGFNAPDAGGFICF